MKRKTYKISFFSYLAVSIVIFFVTVSAFLVSSSYFSAGKVLSGNISLSQLDFQILNGLNEMYTSEQNLFMPDEVINNAITILNARDEAGVDTANLIPIFIRIKPVFTLNNLSSLEYLHVELYNENDWVQGSDGFLYYKNILNVGDRVNFNNYFVLSYLISNQHQNASAYLGLEVDAIQSTNIAYLDVWTTAPEEWKSIISIY